MYVSYLASQKGNIMILAFLNILYEISTKINMDYPFKNPQILQNYQKKSSKQFIHICTNLRDR